MGKSQIGKVNCFLEHIGVKPSLKNKFKCRVPEIAPKTLGKLSDFEELVLHDELKGSNEMENARFLIRMWSRGKNRQKLTAQEKSEERRKLIALGYTQKRMNEYFTKCNNLYECTKLFGIGILGSESVWKCSRANLYADMTKPTREAAQKIIQEYSMSSLPTSSLDVAMQKLVDDLEKT